MEELTRLAHAARLGEPGALEAFIAISYDQVRRLCAGMVDGQSADDLAQETFLRCVRALQRFRGDASARTWLLSIARHVCLDELRAGSRRERRDAAVAALAGPRREPDVADTIAVTDLLARLEPDRRSAFVLTQLLRLSYDEAAEVCGCPVGTVRSRVARGRGDLIAMLGDLPADGSGRAGNQRPGRAG
jgi:RNA polymerase sigma-70 factor (ECF subfamily)